jgi:hypothetical protein
MGNSLSKLYEDYELYELLCENVGVKPLGMSNGFYGHEEKLMEEHGWEKTYLGYKKKPDEIETKKDLESFKFEEGN